VKKYELPNILAACHIGLMILKQVSRPRWVTPNKLFDYLFSGLPTIVNFPGTTAELVEADGVGVASIPGDARDLADNVRYYADRPNERAAIGAHARKVAYTKYDRRQIASDLAELLETVLREERGAAPAVTPQHSKTV
jgi:glycosyltransferase involved in cell wall biosynthesis